MARKARLAVFLAVTVFAGLACQAALGYWSGTESVGNGKGAAGAASVNQGAAPTASEIGSTTVIVKWGSSSLSNGVPADGYIVKRFAEATGAQATIGTGCAGTIAAETCTEAATPVGNWEYSVTPVFSSNWRGEESVKSGAVNTGPGSLTLSRALFGGTVAPLPAIVSGSVSGFGPNQAIKFFLDGTDELVGSPANVGAGGGGSFSLTLPADTADGPHSLSVRSATTEASSGIIVDNTAPTIAIVVEPLPNAAGWNNTEPVEVGGAVDDGDGSGVAFAKYTDDGSDPKTSPTSQYALGPVAVTTTSTLRFYLADNAGNESAVQGQQIKIDTSTPFFSVAFSDIHGGAYIAPANELTGEPGDAFYRGATAGSLRFLMTPLPLGGSPAVSAGFSALPPDAFGFSFDSSAVSTPTGGPFLSNPISWVAGSTSTPAGTISLSNEAGSTFGSPGMLHNDSAPPAGGSVDAIGLTGAGGRYSTTLNLNLALARGADSGSGLGDGTGPSDLPDKLQRAVAPLSTSDGISQGQCGTYSAFVQIGADNPPSSVADTVPAGDSCYLYRYLVSDHVGNVATYESQEVKVDTTLPASPTLRFSGLVNAYWSGTGATVFYRPGASSGGFRLTATSSDGASGIASYAFPNLPAGWSGVSGGLGIQDYSWSAANPTAPTGGQSVVASNNAGGQSSAAFLVLVSADITPPSGGSVSYADGYTTAAAVHVVFSKGTDTGSGLDSASGLLQRSSATLSGGTCGAFSGFETVATNPVSNSPNAVTTGCYRYRYLISDNVGNQATYVSASTVKVDRESPVNTLTVTDTTSAYSAFGGASLFYKGNAAGSFRFVMAVEDPASGAASATFPAVSTIGWIHGAETISSPAGGPFVSSVYSWTANPGNPSMLYVVGTDAAGKTASRPVGFTSDITAPASGSITYPNGVVKATSVPVTLANGTDGGSGIDTTTTKVQRDLAPLTTPPQTCGTFAGTFATTVILSGGADTTVSSGSCYRYRYIVSDRVGNSVTYSSPNIAKVDTSGP